MTPGDPMSSCSAATAPVHSWLITNHRSRTLGRVVPVLRFADPAAPGDEVVTSPIVALDREARTVRTRSGSVYRLGRHRWPDGGEDSDLGWACPIPLYPEGEDR